MPEQVKSVTDQLQRWGPQFGAAWLASKVLVSQLFEAFAAFRDKMGGDADHIRLLASALGYPASLATSMGTFAAVLVLLGLVANCIKLYHYYKVGKVKLYVESTTVDSDTMAEVRKQLGVKKP